MLNAKRVSAVSVMSLVAAAAIAVQAQELPQAPPAQDPAPSTIFGPVRRLPAPAPADFLPWSPETGLLLPRLLPSQRAPQMPSVSTTPRVTGERPVCLRTVPVDPKIDPSFVQPVPEVGATIQRVVPPPCVNHTDSLTSP